MKNLKSKSLVIKFIWLAILTAFVLLAQGCTGRRILKKYYIIEPSMAPVLADSVHYQTLPFSVVVNPFTVRDAFKTKQIALRSQSNELQYFIYHVWGEPLDQAMRYFIWRRLDFLKVFKQTSMSFSNNIPQYMIDGSVNVLEWQKPTKQIKKPLAHIQMIFDFKDFKTGTILVEHSFDRTEPLPKKSGMNDFVVAVNRILNTEVDIFIQKIIAKMK